MGAIDTKLHPTFADIEAAAKRLAGVAVRTPLINAPMLDELLGARVFLKAETMLTGTPSASGGSRPKGPTRVGPQRFWMRADTLRSNQTL